MSFIGTTRIYSKQVSLYQWQPYFFDLLFIGALWLAYDSFGFLRSFDGRTPLLIGSPYAVSVMSGLGIGGIRLSMYIAIIRKNRAPQRLEWITCLAGIAFMVIFILFGGTFLNLWGETHGYRRCPVEQTHNADAVLARGGTPCPPHWQGRPPE